MYGGVRIRKWGGARGNAGECGRTLGGAVSVTINCARQQQRLGTRSTFLQIQSYSSVIFLCPEVHYFRVTHQCGDIRLWRLETTCYWPSIEKKSKYRSQIQKYSPRISKMREDDSGFALVLLWLGNLLPTWGGILRRASRRWLRRLMLPTKNSAELRLHFTSSYRHALPAGCFSAKIKDLPSPCATRIAPSSLCRKSHQWNTSRSRLCRRA